MHKQKIMQRVGLEIGLGTQEGLCCLCVEQGQRGIIMDIVFRCLIRWHSFPTCTHLWEVGTGGPTSRIFGTHPLDLQPNRGVGGAQPTWP